MTATAEPIRTSVQQLLDLCERFYARDGYVKWVDVGKALGISRQAVHSRLESAVRRGDLTAAQYDRFRSSTSRVAASRGRRLERRELEKLRTVTLLTPENHAWLQTEKALRRSTSTDIINGLITKARLEAS